MLCSKLVAKHTANIDVTSKYVAAKPASKFSDTFLKEETIFMI